MHQYYFKFFIQKCFQITIRKSDCHHQVLCYINKFPETSLGIIQTSAMPVGSMYFYREVGG